MYPKLQGKDLHTHHSIEGNVNEHFGLQSYAPAVHTVRRHDAIIHIVSSKPNMVLERTGMRVCFRVHRGFCLLHMPTRNSRGIG